jgi:hypothetical protein
MKALTKEKWSIIIEIATALRIPAHNLAAVIAFESSETFDPSIKNPYSGAVGLLQFTELGLTSLTKVTTKRYDLKDIAAMDFRTQMDYPVYEYLRANKAAGCVHLSDLYMSVLCPKNIGKSSSATCYPPSQKAYEQNIKLDVDKNGLITKIEAARKVYAKLNKVVLRLQQLDEEI